MEFNEKIIKLRKQKGLSQEQLGYQLGVTRQTVSKWELGMTTPEMDKLIEISKLFNISLDELLKGEDDFQKSNNEGSTNQSTYNNYTKNEKEGMPLLLKIFVIVIIVAIIIGLAYLIINGIIKYNDEKKDREYKEKIQERVVDQVDKINGNDIIENSKDFINYYKDTIKETKDSTDEDKEFNNSRNKVDDYNTYDDSNEINANEYYQDYMKINQELINKAYETVIKDDDGVNENINEIQSYIQNGINNMNIR